MFDLSGKVALITGANGGIPRAPSSTASARIWC
jgi:NAD(P)-dependent dehydrogenase (short-subunit alcohol dehydrogenase family)